MTDSGVSFDPTSASAAIAEILSRKKTIASPIVTLQESRHVISMHSNNFENLDEFRDAYLALKRPALCFAYPDELTKVIRWVRDSDDIAIFGEAPELTQWRFDRVARNCSQQLDPLTQVYQRDHLIDTLLEVCQSATTAQPVSLILLDVDHLKAINDEFGPIQGNYVLKQLGLLIQTLCQMTLVARTRGGEFAILIESDQAIARRVAEVIKCAIDENNWSRFSDISVSLGIASVTTSCKPSTLLMQADEALFSAKANGRDRIVSHHEIAEISNQVGEEVEVITLGNKARVMSERVTSFVTQQSKLIMQNLRKEANTDGLTQLYNRRYFDKRIEEEFKAATAQNRSLSVALVDVDHFGEVNKEHGWPTGDQALRTISQTIASSLRNSDWVGRYGGEELCIVMPSTEVESAEQVCERIRAKVESMVFENSNGQAFHVTLSIGLAALDSTSDRTHQDLIERVSDQTLNAKRQGRNRVCR